MNNKLEMCAIEIYIQLVQFEADGIEAQRDLIEGGAGGGEGASGVGQDPVHPLSHPAGVIYVYHIYLIALWLNR